MIREYNPGILKEEWRRKYGSGQYRQEVGQFSSPPRTWHSASIDSTRRRHAPVDFRGVSYRPLATHTELRPKSPRLLPSANDKAPSPASNMRPAGIRSLSFILKQRVVHDMVAKIPPQFLRSTEIKFPPNHLRQVPLYALDIQVCDRADGGEGARAGFQIHQHLNIAVRLGPYRQNRTAGGEPAEVDSCSNTLDPLPPNVNVVKRPSQHPQTSADHLPQAANQHNRPPLGGTDVESSPVSTKLRPASTVLSPQNAHGGRDASPEIDRRASPCFFGCNAPTFSAIVSSTRMARPTDCRPPH